MLTQKQLDEIEKNGFPKWCAGWHDGGGQCMDQSVARAWLYGRTKKPEGCSWYAYGYLMAREQNFGRALQRDEERGYTHGNVQLSEENDYYAKNCG